MKTEEVFSINQEINAKLLDITQGSMPDNERRAIASDIRERVNKLCVALVEMDQRMQIMSMTPAPEKNIEWISPYPENTH